VHHGKERVKGSINLFPVVIANAAGGSLGERAKVVGLFETVFGHPSDAAVSIENVGKKGLESKKEVGIGAGDPRGRLNNFKIAT